MKKMEKDQTLKIGRSPSGSYRDVRYTYTKEENVIIPIEIFNDEKFDGDKTLIEWIKEWRAIDADDIKIVLLGTFHNYDKRTIRTIS